MSPTANTYSDPTDEPRDPVPKDGPVNDGLLDQSLGRGESVLETVAVVNVERLLDSRVDHLALSRQARQEEQQEDGVVVAAALHKVGGHELGEVVDVLVCLLGLELAQVQLEGAGLAAALLKLHLEKRTVQGDFCF